MRNEAQIFIPDGAEERVALQRTTDLCFAAHQDDIEIMAYSPIAKCFNKESDWFTGVVVTDGAGSPRSGLYASFTDEDMKEIRVIEQKTAATIGGYSAMAQLGYPSSAVKDKQNKEVIAEIAELIKTCRPETIYTHNLADKHDTHVAVAVKVIAAVRSLPAEFRPKKVYSLEVWRGLDWVCDEQKAVFDTSKHPNLAAALLGVFDSQIEGGKRYDLAAIGRRCANATFFASHAVDTSDSVSYGMDITDLVNSGEDLAAFISKYIEDFASEVTGRINHFV